MQRSILYLGLTPPPGVIHYPVIRTEKIEGKELETAKQLWPQFTHVIFTSKTTVHYWDEDLTGKICIAIGEGTANALRKRGVEPLTAPSATQEGVVELLESMDLSQASIFLPRSKRARKLLENRFPCYVLDLYDTQFQKLEPVPDLKEIDEIIFTSPSTVEGFWRIYGRFPKRISLTPIGPITRNLLKIFADKYN